MNVHKEYLLDTGWACGWIKAENDIVIDTAPIFRKFIGSQIEKLKRIYKLTELACSRSVVRAFL